MDAEKIPSELREKRNWVVWRKEERDGKSTKVPYHVGQAFRASSTNPVHWDSFHAAMNSMANGGVSGIGFVLSDADKLVGIDLDGCLSDAGLPLPWADRWIARLRETYCEISPSGKGVKAFLKGTIPASIATKTVEMYASKRFFTVTGQSIGNNVIVEDQTLINDLYQYATSMLQQQRTIEEDQRRQHYVMAALNAELDRVKNAPEGMRNDTLNRATFAIARYIDSGRLDYEEVANAFIDAAMSNGLSRGEAIGTVTSALKAGIENPKHIPEPKQQGAQYAPRSASDSSSTELVETPWWRQGVTLKELQNVEFPALQWIVHHIMPEGVTLLAAKPKMKKSWLALNIALAVALGGKALGHLEVMQGRVLYLDLEGNQRRIQHRVGEVLGIDVTWPETFHVWTNWVQGDECLTRLEQWMIIHPDTKLVVVDLLSEVRPPIDPRQNSYQYDRIFLVELNRFAERYGIAILVIHHTRKAKGDDVFDEVSGTLGINSAVATMWILSRTNEGTVVLSLSGRDLIHDDPLALRWDAITCSFIVDGTAAEASASAERKVILDLMQDGHDWTPRQMAVDLGKSVNTVNQLLRRMVAEGVVDKVGYGKYRRGGPGHETF